MANDDYDEVDETADPVDDEVEEEGDDDGPVDAAASGENTPAASRTDIDEAETLTVSSKEAMRRQLEEEMERFLARGGKVQEIPPDVTADPPQKPVSNYGSKPI